MKSEITISELAKLMNVSVHQIRYFEEKGVLEPAYTDNNQYRMYSIEQVYQLAHILLLRKLGVPVHSIKVCMTSFSFDQYRQLNSAFLTRNRGGFDTTRTASAVHQKNII